MVVAIHHGGRHLQRTEKEWVHMSCRDLAALLKAYAPGDPEDALETDFQNSVAALSVNCQ
jgi:hypothetical protein